jgi:glutathione S-transferase
MRLYIGNKTYSSWSLRGWLVAKLSGEPFDEIAVPLDDLVANPARYAFLPSRLVPCLVDRGAVVWDTLAIAEYLAERHPAMWPDDRVARAHARSIVCEMHSGFATLRNDMTMCIRERVDVRPWSPKLARDIERITQIFDETRRRFGNGGAFLFGRYSIADCFFAPVAFRFQTYAVKPTGVAAAYVESLLAHPDVKAWERDALAETAVIEVDEPRIVYREKLAAKG